MDLLRRTGWLCVLTMALLALGSTAVAAQPHGPPAEVYAGVSSDGTASEAGLSLVVTANAVGLLVDVAERGTDLGAAGAASSSASTSVRAPRPVSGSVQARSVLIQERPLRHRLCVYRL